MKNVIIFLGFFFIFGIVLNAQNDKTFKNLGEAKEAYSNKKFGYYVPHDLKKFKKFDSKKEIMITYPSDKIVLSDVIGGKLYVIMEKGTNFVANLDSTNLKIYKCHNTVYGIWDPPKDSILSFTKEEKKVTVKEEKKSDTTFSSSLVELKLQLKLIQEKIEKKSTGTTDNYSFWSSPTTWIVVGGTAIVIAVVAILWPRNNTTSSPIAGKGPGGSTGPAF